MMMNQGGSNTQTIAAVDPISLENRHIVGGNQGQASSYYPSTTGTEASTWQQTHRVENSSTDNGVHSHPPTYQYDQTAASQPPPASSASSSNGTVNPLQDYSSYDASSYQNPADPYGYGSAGYQGYYNNYPQQQQLNNQSYTQAVRGGAYQNTGAPYQPISTFQNSGSYAGSASYSSTYYNPADYQTAGGYASSSYTNQTTAWNGGNYPNYTSQQYAPPYTPEAPGVYTPAAATSTPQTYQQQWADYYNQTEVSCAPGTENLSVTSTQNVGCPVPGVTTGYQTSVSLPPPPPLPSYAPSWRAESSSSELPSVQSGAAVNGAHDAYWNHVAPESQPQNHHIPPMQPQVQKPFDHNSSYDSFQDQQKTAYSQPSSVQYPASQQVPYVSHTYQTPSQAVPSVDTRRVHKVQIPANPRFTSNVTFGLLKADKDISSASPAAKPAYIGVSLPKPVDKASSSSSDSLLKSGMFPKSLRGYVERALARCKDDTQMAASQVLMKEIITKATADSTLYTRDWDTEPLFPLPKEDATIKELSSSNLVPSLLNKISPTRRSKSRWEPLSEEKSEKSVERPASWNGGSQNNGAWGHVSNKERKPFVWNVGSKNGNMSNAKFPSLEQKSASRFNQKPFKKQRLSDGVDATENGHASSDSDTEQGLAAYYAGVIALADSPEERKRREHRSKRFEKVQGHRGQNNHFKPKNAGAQNMYTRRANALAISNKFEDGADRAVEDIDWDSLTVKGTCQEIEKRYLRLTSAPDPATVRPEDVLENALLMVKNSQKNYLFKCDQLKSIRQDLTVQRIRNQLTVKVYETHARIALEVGDLPEYNQCQSQLISLYAEGIEGCHMEFSAYNLLCAILHSNNNRDLLSSMSSLSVETRRHEVVKHALAVRAAVTSGNYVRFFRLYKTAPNLSTCLMDLYVEKMRFKAVTCMCRSYRPTIPVSYVAQILGFTSASEESEEKDTEGLEECIEWLKLHGACPVADNNGELQLDAKSTSSSLYMPETDAVSHGDANLAVNDFFTRTPS